MGIKDVVIKHRCHPELDSGSSTQAISQQQRQTWKMPYQVRHDRLFWMNDAKAFTLIELLVVVLIIGILAAVAVPQYQKAVWKSRYATIKSLVQSLANAEETHYLANGEYTTDIDVLSVDIPPATSCSSTQYKRICTYPWGTCTVKSFTTESSYIECILYKNNTTFLGYQQTLLYSNAYPGKTLCFAYSGDDSAKAICKSETGHNTPDYKTGYYYN